MTCCGLYRASKTSGDTGNFPDRDARVPAANRQHGPRPMLDFCVEIIAKINVIIVSLL